ncbi:hypothetical protein VQ643_06305 [Pseudomonas sp. F1_0610]|uniref:hypothetical protein n=1 Tax=Pseudomonas sp. F1_0610 TaxID=3114284 RepID=UPI0039C032D0
MISSFFTLEHPKEVRDALELRAAQLVIRILNASDDEFLQNRIYRHYSLIDERTTPAVTDHEKLDQISQDLRDSKQITLAQTEAFLCLPPIQSNALANWQSLILFTSLEHKRLFGETARSLRAMSSFRLLLQDKQENKNPQEIELIERNLPDPLQWSGLIIVQLSAFLDAPPVAYETYIRQRLLPIRRILADVQEEEQKNVRSREQRSSSEKQTPKQEVKQPDIPLSPVKRGQFSSVSKSARVDDDQAEHTLVQEYPDKTDSTLNNVEFASDNAPERSYITLAPDETAPASLKRSFMLSAIRAKTVAGHIERNEKRLVTMTSHLTRHDINSLKKAVQVYPPSQPEVMLVLHLMFTTGRRMEQILRAQQVEHSNELSEPGDAIAFQENGKAFWMYKPDLPRHELAGNLGLLVDQQKNPVILPLPFSPAMDWARYLPDNTESLRQAIADFINDVNRDYKTKLTSNRIGDFLSNYLHHQGVDDVVNALVTGNPEIQEAGTYYHQFDHTEILSAYELFTKEFFSNAIPDDIKTPLINRDGGGSQLIVKHQAVSALFAHLTAKVHANKGIAEFHNAYTFYILHLLNLATGHRPVRDAFDDLSHIDLLNKKIYISDKESRQTASSARVLVLPEAAIQQIQLYLEHLKNIQLLLHSIDPQLADAVEMTLSGNSRLLFLLQENQLGSYQIQSLGPKEVKAYLGALFDIPTNWHRHFLRTMLAKNKISGELIDSWMGHAKIGQEGYSQYSGLSMQSLNKIADIIDQIMKDLDVQPVHGWGGHSL